MTTHTARLSQAGAIVACEDCPLRRCEAFRPFSEEELAFVARFKTGELRVAAGTDIFLAGHNSAHVFTLLRGWAFRYSLLEDGKRQILNFLLPGDILGLQAGIFETMQHSVAAVSDVILCVFQRGDLWRLYREQPSLGFDVTWLAAHEESLVDENLVSVGQRPAASRIAFLLLQFHERLKGLAMVRGKKFEFPLTQQHIADALGLSLVHTNKTLRRLVRDGIIAWSGGHLTLERQDALQLLARTMLHERRPRPMI